MPNPDPAESATPFFLIVADQDRSHFCVEGPLTDDHPWQNGVRFMNDRHYRRITCGPTGPDRDALAAEFQKDSKFACVPPGSLVRPRG